MTRAIPYEMFAMTSIWAIDRGIVLIALNSVERNAIGGVIVKLASDENLCNVD